MDSETAAICKSIATTLGVNSNTKAEAITAVTALGLPPASIAAIIVAERAKVDLQAQLVANRLPINTKLPKFNAAAPRTWIKHCQWSCPVYNMQQMIAQLPTDVIAQLDDNDVANCDAYDKFSDLVLPKVEGSIEENLSKLLETQVLGDHQPSQFLNKLQTLAQQAQQPLDSALIKQKFISAMPAVIRPPLAALRSPPIREIAETADRMMAALNVTAPSTTRDFPPVSSVDDLAERVAAILQNKRSRPNMSQQGNRRSRNNSTNRGGGRGGAPTCYNCGNEGHVSRDCTNRQQSNATKSVNNANCVCFYHMKFGDRAFKCTPPCVYKTLQLKFSGNPSNNSEASKASLAED